MSQWLLPENLEESPEDPKKDPTEVKEEMEKISLCDVPNKIYPNLEKIFVNLLADSGYPGIKFEKKIDFTELYKKKSN